MKRRVIQYAFLAIFIAVVLSGKMVLWLGIFVAALLAGKLYGRVYCGYMCPMNTVIQGVEKLSIKNGWQTKTIPKLLQNKYLPWIVLVGMIAMMLMSKRVLHMELPILLILMAVSILMTIRYEQKVFHNNVCPYGAILSIVDRKSRFATQVDADLCIGCKKCEKVCPSGAIQVSSLVKKATVDKSICHQCTDLCQGECPTNAIQYKKN